MYQAIVFLPLAGFLIAGLFGRFIGPRPSEIITTSLLFVAAALAWVTFVGFLSGQTPTLDRAARRTGSIPARCMSNGRCASIR